MFLNRDFGFKFLLNFEVGSFTSGIVTSGVSSRQERKAMRAVETFQQVDLHLKLRPEDVLNKIQVRHEFAWITRWCTRISQALLREQ